MLRRRPRRLSEQARLLIEQAEALGEPPEDPLLLFSVLYGFWVANYVAFNGDADARACGAVPGARREARDDRPAHDRASAHGHVLADTGDIAQGRAHFDRAIALYDPAEHRPLALRFGQDARVGNLVLSGRWPCGCLAIPTPRSQTASTALKDAREIGQAATLMFALQPRIVHPYLVRELRGCKR